MALAFQRAGFLLGALRQRVLLGVQAGQPGGNFCAALRAPVALLAARVQRRQHVLPKTVPVSHFMALARDALQPQRQLGDVLHQAGQPRRVNALPGQLARHVVIDLLQLADQARAHGGFFPLQMVFCGPGFFGQRLALLAKVFLNAVSGAAQPVLYRLLFGLQRLHARLLFGALGQRLAAGFVLFLIDRLVQPRQRQLRMVQRGLGQRLGGNRLAQADLRVVHVVAQRQRARLRVLHRRHQGGGFDFEFGDLFAHVFHLDPRRHFDRARVQRQRADAQPSVGQRRVALQRVQQFGLELGARQQRRIQQLGAVAPQRRIAGAQKGQQRAHGRRQLRLHRAHALRVLALPEFGGLDVFERTIGSAPGLVQFFTGPRHGFGRAAAGLVKLGQMVRGQPPFFNQLGTRQRVRRQHFQLAQPRQQQVALGGDLGQPLGQGQRLHRLRLRFVQRVGARCVLARRVQQACVNAAPLVLRRRLHRRLACLRAAGDAATGHRQRISLDFLGDFLGLQRFLKLLFGGQRRGIDGVEMRQPRLAGLHFFAQHRPGLRGLLLVAGRRRHRLGQGALARLKLGFQLVLAFAKAPQRFVGLPQRGSHRHVQRTQLQMQAVDAGDARQRLLDAGLFGHDARQVVAVVQPARHIVAVALELAAARRCMRVALRIRDALDDDVLQVTKRDFLVRHGGGDLVKVVERRRPQRIHGGQPAQLHALFGELALVQNDATVLVQKQFAADLNALRLDARLELFARHELVVLVVEKFLPVAAVDEVELRRIFARAAVHDRAAQVAGRFALILKSYGAAGVGQRVGNHRSQPGATQNLLRRRAIEQRQQAQKGGFAHTVVAHGQHAAARVQLGHAPGRQTVLGVADVDGNDAPKLMRHEKVFLVESARLNQPLQGEIIGPLATRPLPGRAFSAIGGNCAVHSQLLWISLWMTAGITLKHLVWRGFQQDAQKTGTVGNLCFREALKALSNRCQQRRQIGHVRKQMARTRLQQGRALFGQRAIRPDRGTRRHACSHAGCRVLNHQTARARRAQMAGGRQVHIGCRFGARHFVAAEDAAVKPRHQPDLSQLHFDLETVSARRAGNALGGVRVRGLHGVMRARNRHQPRLQLAVAPRIELGHPVFGQRLAGVGFDQHALVAHRLADKHAHAFFRRKRPAAFSQQVAQHAIGDRLAVHQHAVAVKQDGFKLHFYSLINSCLRPPAVRKHRI